MVASATWRSYVGNGQLTSVSESSPNGQKIRQLMPSVITMFTLLIVLLAILTLTGPVPWLAGTTIFVWGALALGLVSPLQRQVVNEASGAPNLASTLNQGAFNIGNAAGAFAGELALTDGLSYDHIPWIGAGLAAFGLGFSLLSHLLDRRATRVGEANDRSAKPLTASAT
jgi:DHA1 family inner membrane transport protein